MCVCMCHILCHILLRHMGWLRLVGSLKSQVCCAECSLFCRALLQKRPIILRSLLIVATIYTCASCILCLVFVRLCRMLCVIHYVSSCKVSSCHILREFVRPIFCVLCLCVCVVCCVSYIT